MNSFRVLTFAGLTAGALLAGVAQATPINLPPPPGAIYSLDGQPIPATYTQYTTAFKAGVASTSITFALRNDYAWAYLDNISVTTGAGPNLILNPGFEDGTTGWTYLNEHNAPYGGTTQCQGGGQGGSGCAWVDGAMQSYDTISQAISTTIGATYTISFWALSSDTSNTNWSALSTNGQNGPAGNGANIAVYALGSINVPEPAAFGMFGLGALLIGLLAGLRRRFD